MMARAAALLPATIAALLLCACSEPLPPSAITRDSLAELELETVVAEEAEFARETIFDGRVEAIDQATVSAQTAGRVVELPFDVGDHVERDAVIVRFTTVEQRSRSEAAEAALSEAQARMAEARLAYDRARDLHERHLIARADFDRARTELDTAQARVEAGRASVAEAREALAHTVIRAPYTGLVVARHVQLGETVIPGTPLMTGLSLEHLRAAVDVPQEHIGPLRREQRARAILPDGRSVAVTELRFPPNADPATHSFRVLAELPPGEHGIFPGTLVKIAFVHGAERRLFIPARALARRGEVTGAYVLGDGRIGFRYLRVGTPAADGRVPVLAGLAAGERVVLDPVAGAALYRRLQDAGEGT